MGLRNLVLVTWLSTFSLVVCAQEKTEAPKIRKTVKCSIGDTRASNERSTHPKPLSEAEFQFEIGSENEFGFIHQTLHVPDGHDVEIDMAPFLKLKDTSGGDVITYNGFIRITHPTDTHFLDKQVHLALVGGTEFSMVWNPLNFTLWCSEQ